MHLDDVRIQNPCSKEWRELDGGERQRYCSECSLHVVNLSDLTRAEGKALLASHDPNARLCVSFQRGTDGRILTLEDRVPAPPRRRSLEAAAATLLGLFPVLAACRPLSTEAPHPEPLPETEPVEEPVPLEVLGEVEMLGTVALPEPEPVEPEEPGRVMGRMALPHPSEEPPQR